MTNDTREEKRDMPAIFRRSPGSSRPISTPLTMGMISVAFRSQQRTHQRVKDFRPDIRTNLSFYRGIIEDPDRIETLNAILNALESLGLGKLVQNFSAQRDPERASDILFESLCANCSAVTPMCSTSNMSRQVRCIRLIFGFSYTALVSTCK